MIPWTRRSQRDWEYIARVLALDVGPTQRRFPGLLHGYMAGYRLRLQSSGEGVLLTVDSQGEIPSELRIAWTSSGLELEGPDHLVLAALTSDAQRAIAALTSA